MLPDLSVVICESTLTTTTPATTKAVKTMPTFENIFGLFFSKLSSIVFFLQKLFISGKKDKNYAVLFFVVLTFECNL